MAFPCRASPRLSLSALLGFLPGITILIAGSSFPLMLAHAVFDVIVGILLADGLRRWSRLGLRRPIWRGVDLIRSFSSSAVPASRPRELRPQGGILLYG